MGSETARHLRKLIPCDKEFKTTKLEVGTTAVLFNTSLTLGNSRKRLTVYNNTNDNSGECFFGPSDVTIGSGQLIPKGEPAMEIPLVSGEIGGSGLYFIAQDVAELRIFECA